ncbi:MAG: Gfo/Idh/MocA family oxidoreductase, partial [Phycisphaerales bacterium]|nr:Gfo/Idh/MocA family oxidoreductase [Phycisphaerales bacterium]
MGGQPNTRRSFLKQTAATTATMGLLSSTAQSTERVYGANERIQLALLGAGAQGTTLYEKIHTLETVANVELIAIGDIWNKARESAVARMFGRAGRKPLACRKMDEILDQREVDAVVIANADFQHAWYTRKAVEAGRDVYVEKPFGCDFEQIKQARDAVKQNDRIVQLGTQRRSLGFPWAAREFIAQGRLGKVSYVEITQSNFGQRWRIPGSEHSLTAADTDWDEWLCYNPKTPFNARHYREFRLFWPYSTGIFCQWMSHAIDLVNLVLDEVPQSAVSAGGVYVWEDGRINPDTAQCLLEYPSGCLVSYHMRLGNQASHRWITFFGTCGTLELEAGVAYGEGGLGHVVCVNPGAEYPEFQIYGSRRLPDRASGGVMLEYRRNGDDLAEHLKDFLDCMRSRRQPRANIDAAFADALATT